MERGRKSIVRLFNRRRAVPLVVIVPYTRRNISLRTITWIPLLRINNGAMWRSPRRLVPDHVLDEK